VFDVIKDLCRANGPDVCMDIIRCTVQMENNSPLNFVVLDSKQRSNFYKEYRTFTTIKGTRKYGYFCYFVNYFRYFQVAEFQYVLLVIVLMHFCTPCLLRRPGHTPFLRLYVQNAIQDRWWTYNATMRRVRATIFAVEKQWVLPNLNKCICSLRYPVSYTTVLRLPGRIVFHL